MKNIDNKIVIESQHKKKTQKRLAKGYAMYIGIKAILVIK